MPKQLKSLKPQDLQLLQADFARQAKELTAREEYLDERERLIESGPLDLKVLEETIKAKQGQLEQVKADFLKKESWYKTRLDGLEQKIDQKESKITELIDEVTALSDDMKVQTDLQFTLQTNIKLLEKQIAERVEYQKQQEKLIEETIDEGNAALRGIGYEIQAAQEQRDSIKAEVAEVEMKKTDIAFELMQLEERFNKDKFELDEELDKIREQAHSERKTIAALKAEQGKIVADTKEKMHKLDVREQEIVTKQGALVRERKELEDDKRRWNSTKSLYDIQ
jgi:chromosome segregation ATPase